MGKIHRALEKSKKEHQRIKRDPFDSADFKSKSRMGRKDPIDETSSEKIVKSENSHLGMIHAILDDESKIETLDKDKNIASKGDKDSENVKIKKINTYQKSAHEILDTNKVDGERGSKRPDTSNKGLRINDFKKDRIPWVDQTAETPDRRYYNPIPDSGNLVNLHHSLITALKPRSFEAEQFKILRTNLLFPENGQLPKTILVTSAVPGEGKTFTAINLAVSLAQNLNNTVLLVDADIRKPEVHQRFGFNDNINGLSEFLSESKPIPSLLVKTQIPNLTLLPGGSAVSNPSELISSDKMKKLINELATRYSDRFIIIDAPPPKMAAETFALAQFVERIIPVVRSGRSNRELVNEMLRLFGRGKIHGVVLNYYDSRDTKRFGYHKYSEYYSK